MADEFKRAIQQMAKLKGQHWRCRYKCCYGSERKDRRQIRRAARRVMRALLAQEV